MSSIFRAPWGAAITDSASLAPKILSPNPTDDMVPWLTESMKIFQTNLVRHHHQDKSRVWMAASQQHKVDNQLLAFSHCLSLRILKQGFGDRMFFLMSEETLESGNLFSSS